MSFLFLIFKEALIIKQENFVNVSTFQDSSNFDPNSLNLRPPSNKTISVAKKLFIALLDFFFIHIWYKKWHIYKWWVQLLFPFSHSIPREKLFSHSCFWLIQAWSRISIKKEGRKRSLLVIAERDFCCPYTLNYLRIICVTLSRLAEITL